MAGVAEKSKGKKEIQWRVYTKPLLIGTIVGTAAAVLMLLLCALTVSCFSLPTAAMRLMAILTVAAGGFAGGYGAARAFRKKGLFMGGCVGVILALVLTIGGVLFTKEAPAMQSLTKFAILIASAMIGGVLGVNAKKKRR